MHMVMIFHPSMLKKTSLNVVWIRQELYLTLSRPRLTSQGFHIQGHV